jgi:glutamate N-acetyltransferase/amino-acid N-acetyltransferase
MTTLKRSGLAPSRFPKIPQVFGLEFKALRAGIKYTGRDDLLLARLDKGATVAGVFTQSTTASAPVQWSREVVNKGKARALLVNSGNANTFTGAKGHIDVKSTAAMAAKAVGCQVSEVLIASTGVIGEPLPVDRIDRALKRISDKTRPASWLRAAQAIGTTDTYPKGAFRYTKIGETDITIGGIAKGSGMIAPDMATMLAFVFTDASISRTVLDDLLREGVQASFNSITVDSDTSTSDSLILAATGRAGNRVPKTKNAPDLKLFRAALKDLLIDLATQVVRDGEGAQKFITVDVCGASSTASAKKAALAIANSPLVKTAIAGEDANWGRVVMAVGKSGAPLNQEKLSVAMGGVTIAQAGGRVEGYDEKLVTEHLKGQEVGIQVNLGVGRSKARVWTCDFTHDYITINAEYRT